MTDVFFSKLKTDGQKKSFLVRLEKEGCLHGVYERQRGEFREENGEIWFLNSKHECGDFYGPNHENWEFVCDKKNL